MALLTNTLLETTPVGTTNLAGIINANWSVLEALFNPALSSGDARYNAFWKAITRNATLPTVPSRIEYSPASGKPVARAGHATITYASTINVASQGAIVQSCTLTGDVTVAFDSIVEGRIVDLILEASGGTRNITWPASIRWLAAAAPSSLASGKQLHVRFIMKTSSASGISAVHHVEP